ncbi:MAG: indolepyruvate ferredoxin oxidoreductase family protein [Neomegalonema sp.]|nr:indolepyruvate ferredoxin oxidoreductase family protein [Neomegalonema sp.]
MGALTHNFEQQGLRKVELDDKYDATDGAVFMTGVQALVRLPMTQMRRDKAAGLNTGAFISGYRGSPLGGYDQQLMRAKKQLDAHGVVFKPGVNEDLAATAIWGTQQLHLSPGARKQGVVGYWYGKGPGVDRSGDVFKHANAAGSAPHGGVLAFAGDDHACKSSTLPHQSDHALAAAIIPVLYPSNIHEFLELGLLGVAMSRYAGVWVGFKVTSETVETSGVIDLAGEQRQFVKPTDFEMPEGGLNLRWPDPPLIQDARLQEHKGYAALAYARANKVDQVTFDSAQAGGRPARFGVVASGKAYEDVREALIELGIGADEAAAIGLRIYKVRMTWPLEPEGVRHFSEGLEEVLIVEERREIIENQIKQQLFNWRADVRPRIVGKFDHEDKPFLSHSETTTVGIVARAIADRLLQFEFDEGLKARISERLEYFAKRAQLRRTHEAPILRKPYYCSGCPHNTSTRVPEGSRALAGIGCHYMATWIYGDRTETFSQMGGEGVSWVGAAPFTDEKHVFTNLGDGTYFHSGLLAIRQAVAGGVNITYKLLVNDAVAMTGGQPIDGELSPGRITHQLHAEGVSPIYVVSDTPEQFTSYEFAPGVIMKHRDEMEQVQTTLRDSKGVSAIVYVQTCATEKRRRRKRGLMDDPDRRVFINTDVCEGCGDCSVQSNCVSIEPVEDGFGRKRRINQSSCNKDFSCVKGFCPSFVSVSGAKPRKSSARRGPDVRALPAPQLPSLGERPYNIAVTGVGGTGVLTIGALIGMAAHLEGKGVMVLDMAGLAQKGGAVLSTIRLADTPEGLSSPRIVNGGADLLLAADDVVAAGADSAALASPERTVGVVNTAVAPVADFVTERDFDFRAHAVEATIKKTLKDSESFVNFTHAAELLTGDAIGANMMMLGYAWQKGLAPLSASALTRAIELNGVAVKANLTAFDWGRVLAADPAQIAEAMAQPDQAKAKPLAAMTIDELTDHRAAHLTAYQDEALAARYRARVDEAKATAAGAGLAPAVAESYVRAIAANYAKLLAYKDEYEVARLYTDPAFEAALKSAFEGEAKLVFHLAPPLLPGKDAQGRPKKRAFGAWMRPVFRGLAKLKWLRGRSYDPFGWTAERKMERRLIADYEALMSDLARKLTSENASIALALLSLPTDIRGFGPVKEAAVAGAEAKKAQLLAQLEAPNPGSETLAAE